MSKLGLNLTRFFPKNYGLDFFCIASWSSYPCVYVVKTFNANLTCTYPPCNALDNFTELFKSVECVVLALDLQHSTWIAVRGVAEHEE